MQVPAAFRVHRKPNTCSASHVETRCSILSNILLPFRKPHITQSLELRIPSSKEAYPLNSELPSVVILQTGKHSLLNDLPILMPYAVANGVMCEQPPQFHTILKYLIYFFL